MTAQMCWHKSPIALYHLTITMVMVKLFMPGSAVPLCPILATHLVFSTEPEKMQCARQAWRKACRLQNDCIEVQ